MPKSTANSTPSVLSNRELNRSLLQRQMLLQRQQEKPQTNDQTIKPSSQSVADTIEWLVGLQAQVPNNPYVALWSRLDGFDPMELSQLLEDRQAVRMTFLRSTLHLVTARDALALTPVIEPVRVRTFSTSSPFGRQTEGLDRKQLLAAGRALIEEKPYTVTDLGKALYERWPEYDAQSLAYNIAYLVPAVQVTPRGLWGRSGRSMITTAESWLGAPLATADAPDNLVLRYLAAFGPASVADIQNWSGLTRVREVIERLRPQLRSFHDEQGRELLDVEDGPLPDPETPAPVRFLPEYDNLFLGHADRSRLVSDAFRKRISRLNGFSAPLFIDGFGSGMWKITQERRSATMAIDLFGQVSPADRNAVAEEGERLLVFMTPDAEARELVFVPD